MEERSRVKRWQKFNFAIKDLTSLANEDRDAKQESTKSKVEDSWKNDDQIEERRLKKCKMTTSPFSQKGS